MLQKDRRTLTSRFLKFVIHCTGPRARVAYICTFQLFIWYLSSIKLESDPYRKVVEAHNKEVEAYKREVEAIKGQMEERDQRLKEKDQRLAKAENESSAIVTALVDVAKRDRMVHQKWGE
jgi:hypothetical protein